MSETKPPMLDPEALERLRHDSGVAITKDGVPTYRGRPIENDRVVELFMRGLDVRDDGKVTLTVGRYVAYPEIEGVARFVRRLLDHDGRLAAALSDGRILYMDDGWVGYAPDDHFYVWFVDVRGPAVLLRDAHQALAGRMADQEAAAVEVGLLAAIPLAASPRPNA